MKWFPLMWINIANGTKKYGSTYESSTFPNKMMRGFANTMPMNLEKLVPLKTCFT